MRAANKKAADAAFQSNNRSGVRDSDAVDLHGLYVEEAVSRLKQRLNEAQTEVHCFFRCLPQPCCRLDRPLWKRPFRLGVLSPRQRTLF